MSDPTNSGSDSALSSTCSTWSLVDDEEERSSVEHVDAPPPTDDTDKKSVAHESGDDIESLDSCSDGEEAKLVEQGCLTFDGFLRERQLSHDYECDEKAELWDSVQRKAKKWKRRKCKAECVTTLKVIGAILSVASISLICMLAPNFANREATEELRRKIETNFTKIEPTTNGTDTQIYLGRVEDASWLLANETVNASSRQPDFGPITLEEHVKFAKPKTQHPTKKAASKPESTDGLKKPASKELLRQPTETKRRKTNAVQRPRRTTYEADRKSGVNFEDECAVRDPAAPAAIFKFHGSEVQTPPANSTRCLVACNIVQDVLLLQVASHQKAKEKRLRRKLERKTSAGKSESTRKCSFGYVDETKQRKSNLEEATDKKAEEEAPRDGFVCACAKSRQLGTAQDEQTQAGVIRFKSRLAELAKKQAERKPIRRDCKPEAIPQNRTENRFPLDMSSSSESDVGEKNELATALEMGGKIGHTYREWTLKRAPTCTCVRNCFNKQKEEVAPRCAKEKREQLKDFWKTKRRYLDERLAICEILRKKLSGDESEQILDAIIEDALRSRKATASNSKQIVSVAEEEKQAPPVLGDELALVEAVEQPKRVEVPPGGLYGWLFEERGSEIRDGDEKLWNSSRPGYVLRKRSVSKHDPSRAYQEKVITQKH